MNKYPYITSAITAVAILASAGFVGFHAGASVGRESSGLADAIKTQAASYDRLSSELERYHPVWCEAISDAALTKGE